MLPGALHAIQPAMRPQPRSGTRITIHVTCLRHDGDEHVVAGDGDLEAGVAGRERGQHVHHSQRPPLRAAERPIAIRRQRRPRRQHLCTARSRVDDRVDDNRNELPTVIGYARATAPEPRSSAHGRTRPALGQHALLGRG